MLGFPDYATAKPEQSRLAKDVVRAVYEAFQPADGSRMTFAERSFGLSLPAAVTVNLSVTKGVAAFTHTGNIPDSKYRGSYVLINDYFYTFAEKTDATNGAFVEPFEGETGTVSAKFFHNSVALDSTVYSVMGSPEMLGYGKLTALTGKKQEIRFSSLVYNDYWPLDGTFYYNTLAVQRGTNNSFLMGVPAFYFIDDTMMGSVFGRRMSFHPLPTEAHTVRLRAQVAPTIPASGELPFPGPSELAEVVLPPILEKIVSASKRYSGKNQRELAEEYMKALAHLKRFAKPQKERHSRIRKRHGY